MTVRTLLTTLFTAGFVTFFAFVEAIFVLRTAIDLFPLTARKTFGIATINCAGLFFISAIFFNTGLQA